MVYKHAYLNTLLLLQSAFMLSVVKMPLKGEVGGHAFSSHGNCIVDRGKSWKNHGIVFFLLLWDPCSHYNYGACIYIIFKSYHVYETGLFNKGDKSLKLKLF